MPIHIFFPELFDKPEGFSGTKPYIAFLLKRCSILSASRGSQVPQQAAKIRHLVKIMVFLHGTAIMHRNAVGQARKNRVHQVMIGEKSVRDFASYVPVGKAVSKLQRWRSQGARIVYLSSHRDAQEVKKDRSVLQQYGFPEGPVYYRRKDEQYADVAARILPDVLIEDDCESIGGEPHMTYPHLMPELQAGIKSVVVREFEGIDHLPDDIRLLMDYPVPD
jgi:hypothetical protein